MALWNPKRSPDKYPIAYHEAVTTIGCHLIAVVDTLTQANHQRKRFNAFKACLRNYPLHRSSRLIELGDLNTRMQIVGFGDGFHLQAWTRQNSTKNLKIALDSLEDLT